MSVFKPIKILSFLTPYAILICTIYLFGYWSSFGINILEFVSLSDIIKLGIYPLIVGTSAFIIGSLSGLIRPGHSYQGREKEIATVKGIHKHTKIIIILMLIAATVILYLFSSPDFWYVSSFAVTLILILTIKDIKMLEPIIPNPIVGSIVLAIGIGLLPMSFGVGKINAHIVLNGKSGKVVNTKIFKDHGTEPYKSKGLIEGQDTLKFIGAAGDYFFLITLDNSTIYIVKYSDLHFLELKSLN
jgi:hypothetical protein